jgi:hypothetical protein
VVAIAAVRQPVAADALESVMQILDLPAGQLLGLSSARAGRVQVLYGRIWLTESGRSEDVFAASGDVIDLSRHGRTLVEGLGYARIAVHARPARGGVWRARLDAMLAPVARALRCLPAAGRRALAAAGTSSAPWT